MCAIKFSSERGGALLTVVVFIAVLGLIGISLAIFMVNDSSVQVNTADRRKAFYSAQSGLEYAIKNFVSSDSIYDYSEQIQTGDGTTCQVDARKIGNDSLHILAQGRSDRFVRSVETTIVYLDSSDVSEYAVYTPNPTEDIVTTEEGTGTQDPSLIKDNASKMPMFDVNELRAIAQASGHYYSGDLTLNPSYHAPDGTIVFVEGDLKLIKVNNTVKLHLVVMGNVEFNSSFQVSSDFYMTIYQPNSSSRCEAKQTSSPHVSEFSGGIISNGYVDGDISNKSKSLKINHDSQMMKEFLGYSVNQGKWLISKSTWRD